jgi:xanthosine utilization system XapX-like protein
MRIAVRVLVSLVCGLLCYIAVSILALLLFKDSTAAGLAGLVGFAVGAWLPWRRRTVRA